MNEDLYTTYGKLMIQAEIIQNQINETKKQIAELINNPQKPVSGEESPK
jgi:hypothetical protein